MSPFGSKKGVGIAKKGLSEAQIQMQICHFLRVKGYFFWVQPSAGFFDRRIKRFRRHSSPYVRKGVPDIIVIGKNGQFIGLEVKSAKGSQSEDQRRFQEALEKTGALYFLVRSLEDVETILGGILHGNSQ